MGPWRWLALLLAAGVSIGVSTGCGSSGDRPSPGASASLDAKRQIEKAIRDSDPQRQAAATAEYSRKQTEHLAKCMADQGFEYKAPASDDKALKPNLGLSDEEYARQYGFGLSTLIDVYGRAGLSSDLKSVKPPAEKAGASAAEKAYAKALRGCTESARKQLGPQPGIVALEQGTGIDSGLQDVSKKANVDPRVVAAKKAFETCAAKRGFTASTGEELRAKVSDRAKPFREAFETRRDELLAQGKSIADLRMADVLDAGRLAELKALQQYEITAAAADRACGAELKKTVEDVNREYMQKFLDGLDK